MPIGDYVYLFAKDMENSKDFSRTIDSQKNDIKKEIKFMKNDALERQLSSVQEEVNSIRSILANPSGSKIGGIDAQLFQDAVKQFVQDSVAADIESIDFEHGTVEFKRKEKGIAQVDFEKSKDIVTQLNEALSQLGASANAGSGMSITSLLKIIRFAKNKEGELTKKALEAQAELKKLGVGGAPEKEINKLLAEALQMIQNKNSKNINKDNSTINTLIKVINYCSLIINPMQAYSLAKGQLFEGILGALAYTKEGYIAKNVQDILSVFQSGKIIKGGNTAIQAFDKTKFNADVVTALGGNDDKGTKTFKRAWGKGGDQFFVTSKASSSQGKVDVTFEIKNGNKPIPLNISAKNVDLSRDSSKMIHVVSNINLLSILAEGEEHFVNTYLNVMSEHLMGDSEQLANQRQDIIKLVRFLSVLKGLTGSTVRIQSTGTRINDSANVFIVQDSGKDGKGIIYVYSMQQILNKLFDKYFNEELKDTKVIAVSIGNSGESEGSTPSLFKNEYIGTSHSTDDALERTAKVIAEAHKQKVKASISFSPFVI